MFYCSPTLCCAISLERGEGAYYQFVSMATAGDYVHGDDLDLILELLEEDFFEKDDSVQSHIDSVLSEVSKSLD